MLMSGSSSKTTAENDPVRRRPRRPNRRHRPPRAPPKTFARLHVGFVNVNADRAKCALVTASRV
jgi:hypothetical protein